MSSFSRWALAAGLASLTAVCAPIKPEEQLRTATCLNGVWETVVNVSDARIPAEEWTHRRIPAMPLVGDPPAVSAWYRRSFTIAREWIRPDRRFFLEIEKAGHYAAIYCNGRRMAEHYGQYTPFEADLTSALAPGKPNEIAIYVHNASGKYARPGAMLEDELAGNAYRGATDKQPQRNWIGIAGDIVLSWRPAASVTDVFVVPSVRKKRLETRVETSGASGLKIRGAVLDEEKVVLTLPEKQVTTTGTIRLEADWSNAVLWGPPPYGKPKLYVLRTELLKQGKVVDRTFTRFGFREVWIEGRDVLLNGKKLWMSGTYFPKLSTVRYLNDRRVQSATISLMQASGLNTLHGHWDDLGKTWMDLCDETGMLVMAGFYCDGRPLIQSRADDGWADWMTSTCRNWTRATRNHPSVVLWRPSDVVPQNTYMRKESFAARLAEEVKREDGTRPLADGSDIAIWSQNHLKDPKNPEVYDDGARVAEQLAAASKPLLTKEIYCSFADFDKIGGFFRAFYEKSQAGGSTGTIVQHLPLKKFSPFRAEWLSDSGAGNRERDPRLERDS